jgi:Na+-driven multidrug efflux pump
MAIAFATAPVAGQNVGADKPDRVRQTFRTAVVTQNAIMLPLTLVCQIQPGIFIAFFTDDPAVIAAGAKFLQIISWNFVGVGIVFTCSGMFQAMGNTVPTLAASVMRHVSFAIPAFWLSGQSWFELNHLWYASVGTAAIQAVVIWRMLSVEMKRKLGGGGARPNWDRGRGQRKSSVEDGVLNES